MPRRTREASPAPFGLDRIVFFSDAVMAIAITLLVIDLRVPEVVSALAIDPWHVPSELLPKLVGYFVSFWVIALYWVAHHRCYRYIRLYDRRLIYINFLFLMFIAFMPFPTALLFSSPALTLPVLFYSGTAAGMGLSLSLLWIYATHRSYLLADISPRLVGDIKLNLLLPPVVFLISVGVALINPGVAMYFWFLLIPVYVLRRHREITVLGNEPP